MQIRAGVVLDEGRVVPVDLDPLPAVASPSFRNPQVAHAANPVSITNPAREVGPIGNLEKRSSIGETASRLERATDERRSQQHEWNPHAFSVIARARRQAVFRPHPRGPMQESGAVCARIGRNFRGHGCKYATAQELHIRIDEQHEVGRKRSEKRIQGVRVGSQRPAQPMKIQSAAACQPLEMEGASVFRFAVDYEDRAIGACKHRGQGDRRYPLRPALDDERKHRRKRKLRQRRYE